MRLIADSGSTKTDWILLIDSKDQTRFQTKGINPRNQDEVAIRHLMESCSSLESNKDFIGHIYFYGAGCTGSAADTLKQLLSAYFENAVVIVESDVVAAAYSCYNAAPEVVGILGTGSNAIYFDGKTIHQETPSLGYILGDEGSGTWLGKRLLADYFYGRIPKVIQDALIQDGVSKERVLTSVYQKPQANAYLASFAHLLATHRNNTYVQKLVQEGFESFVKTHILAYHTNKFSEVNFVGSIAAVFSNELTDVCNSHALQVGRILQKPLDGLIQYHNENVE